MPHPRPDSRNLANFPVMVAILFVLSVLVAAGILLAPDFPDGSTARRVGAETSDPATGAAAPDVTGPRPRTRIGINLAGISDYSPDQIFADAVRNSRGFNATDVPYAPPAAVPTDSEGWPRADFGVLLASYRPKPGVRPDTDGTYGVRFVGQATIKGWMTDTKVRDQHYDPATNTTTALVDAVAGGNNAVSFVFLATRRNPADPPGTGIVDLRVMRPIAAGSTTPHGFDELFSRQALKMLAPFAFHRNLDLNSTNNGGTERASWASRATTKTRTTYEAPLAYEYQVALANACGADLWLTVQMFADDDHVRRLFRLCRFGSNGVEPYTSEQTHPVFAPLRGRLIIEYDNELWNYGFTHAHANLTAAQAEVAAGKSDLDYDKCGNIYYWAHRRVAAQTLRLRDIAAEVYGEEAFGVRFLPVLMSQQGGQDSTSFFGLQLGLDYLKHQDRRPLTKLLAAAGTSWYHSPPTVLADQARFFEVRDAATKAGKPAPTYTPLTADAIFATAPPSKFPAIEALSRMLRDYNLPVACYEGGEYVSPGNPDESRIVQNDPRYGRYVRTTIDQCLAVRPLLLGVFNTTQPPWAIVDSCQDLTTTKFTTTAEAIRAYDAGPQTPVSVPVPASTPTISH